MTELEIKTALAMCEAATPGPWQATHMDEHPKRSWTEIDAGRRRVVGSAAYDTNRYGEYETISGVYISDDDAAFITGARTGYPRALKHILHLEKRHDLAIRQRNQEEGSAMHSGGILSDVADAVFGDETRAETHGYDGVLDEVKRQRALLMLVAERLDDMMGLDREACDALIKWAREFDLMPCDQ